MIIFSTFKGKNEKNASTKDFYAKEYTIELEEKVENFLLTVKGIENVNVIITLESSNDKDDTKTSSNGYFSITTSKDNASSYEIYPSVRGVAIACTNGDNDEVKNKITRLVAAYLGISTNRIEIVNFG